MIVALNRPECPLRAAQHYAGNSSQSEPAIGRYVEHLFADLSTKTPAVRPPRQVLFPGRRRRRRVLSGSVTIFSRSRWFRHSKRRAKLAFLGPCSIVGQLSMIDGPPTFGNGAAIRETSVSFLSRGAFEGSVGLRRSRGLQQLGIPFAARLRETDAAFAAGSPYRPYGPRRLHASPSWPRTSATMLVPAGSLSARRSAYLTSAAMAGISRENASRILNDGKRRKLLSHLSGYYCL